MNALVFSVAAAGCASLSNLFFRKNNVVSKSGYSASGYLVVFYLLCFLFSFVVDSSIFVTEINFTIAFLGFCVGLLNVTMMYLTARAMDEGPSGFTFAFQNASAVFPGLLLFITFGSELGFSLSMFQVLGILLVLQGLFIGAKGQNTSENKAQKASSKWIFYALGCFAVQVVSLTFIQGRCVLFQCESVDSFISSYAISEAADVWFMPGYFGSALIIQALVFLKERRNFLASEIRFGALGGVTNFLAMLFLLFATRDANPWEKAVLFPLYAVVTIILCNVWANKLYNERFNVIANLLCGMGIFLSLL